jgi:hypothetical protein
VGVFSIPTGLTAHPTCDTGHMPKHTRAESRDINHFAAALVRHSTEKSDPVDLNDQAVISQVVCAMGHRGGANGAATLNARLTPTRPEEVGAASYTARWGKRVTE